MAKCFVLGRKYSNKGTNDNDTWDTNMSDCTYSTYEQAIIAAQIMADLNASDVLIFSSDSVVKYPTPSYPVEQIS